MTTTQLGHIARALLTAGTLFALAMLGCGVFGAHVPFFDTMAQFRAHLAVLLVAAGLALLVLRPRLLGAVSVLAGIAGIVAVAPYLTSASPASLVEGSDASTPAQAAAPAPRYTLLQMNLRKDARDKTKAVRLIGALSPDVLTLEEASPGWEPLLGALSPLYPHRYGCAGLSGFNDALILSKRPFVAGDDGECGGDGRFARRAIDFNGTAVDIAAQHLRWPWPGSQWGQIELTTAPHLAALKASKRPVLLAGDFNAVPWSAALKRYADLGGLTVVDGIGPTWFARPFTSWIAPVFGLPIDNVMHSGRIEIVSVARQPATDSDHLPLLVSFTVAPRMPGEPEAAIVAVSASDDKRPAVR